MTPLHRIRVRAVALHYGLPLVHGLTDDYVFWPLRVHTSKLVDRIIGAL